MDLPKNCSIKLTLFNEDYSFGSGLYRLLILIDELKSINKACKEMRMAYSKAYKIIQKAEKDLGYKLILGKIGGKGGGGSTLTKEAFELIEFYEDLNMKTKEFVKKEMEDFKKTKKIELNVN